MHTLPCYRLALTLCIASLAIGCGGESDPETAANLGTEQPFVLHSGMLNDSFFLDREERVRWRFSEGQFVVESFREPLPAHVSEPLLGSPVETYRVTGQWQLFDNGHTLRLEDVRSNDNSAGVEVRLTINPIDRNEIVINGHTYRYSESLPLREIIPDSVYTAIVQEVIQGDLIRVKSVKSRRNPDVAEFVREVKLAGVACPSADDPVGQQAIGMCRELLDQARVFVKVFGKDERGREVAHVWVGMRFVNLELLTEGLARHDKHNDDEWIFATAEDEACSLGRGLWQRNNVETTTLDENIDSDDGNHNGTDG